MKNYTITVNGNVYDVTVEENGSGAASSAPARKAAPVVKTEAKAAAPVAAGGVEILAGAAGKVFKIEAPVGTAVKKGDSVVVLEIMKMEAPVVATCDGTVASINVAVGDSVEAGAVLATINE